jgi:hypothetical protein
VKERDVEQMHNADLGVDRDNAFVQGNFPTEIRILDAPIRMLKSDVNQMLNVQQNKRVSMANVQIHADDYVAPEMIFARSTTTYQNASQLRMTEIASPPEHAHWFQTLASRILVERTPFVKLLKEMLYALVLKE